MLKTVEVELENSAPVGAMVVINTQHPLVIKGAIYDTQGVLQPGCMICAAKIPEKQAKFRSKVCSDECRKELRRVRQTPALLAAAMLHCQVCRGVIPRESAKKQAVVCGVACRNELRRYRWQILKNQKCPHCLHPSSPAEWEEYRQWRQSRGHLRTFMQRPGRGNLTRKREKALRDVLRAAVGALKGELAVILESYCEEGVEGLPVRSSLSSEGAVLALPLEKLIERSEALLDPQKNLVDAEGAE